MIPLFAGLALTAFAVILARQRMESLEADIRRESAPVEIAVARVPISAGAPFSEQNLAKKTVPESGTGRRNVPAKEFELLLGAKARIDIAEGEPILWSDVDEPFEVEKFSMAVPPGRRALTISADANASFSGLLRPGDAVDLLSGDPQGGGVFWVRNIPVIAVDRFYQGNPLNEDPSEAGTITLSVTPDEGRRIASAARDGKLHWFLRNPDDHSPGPTARRIPPGGNAKSVEIWKGGKLQTASNVSPGEKE
ncbi:MAG: Flp pilus assembly protein CpaB [Deltaproteobacteria bacterium]|nr:Flp pilus assembly protein CpaB [Deltaproteobacteria bacterium]